MGMLAAILFLWVIVVIIGLSSMMRSDAARKRR